MKTLTTTKVLSLVMGLTFIAASAVNAMEIQDSTKAEIRDYLKKKLSCLYDDHACKNIGGPYYAAKWKRNNQTILLYGENHIAIHKTPNTQNCQVCQAVDAFFTDLSSVTSKTVLLYEDAEHSPLWDTFLVAEQDFQAAGLQDSRRFCSVVSHFARSLKTTYHDFLQAKCIETRFLFGTCIKLALGYLDFLEHKSSLKKSFKAKVLKCLGMKALAKLLLAEGLPEVLVVEKIYNALKDLSLSDLLEQPITLMHSFSAQTNDPLAKNIFNTIATKVQERKKVLWEVLAAYTGFSCEELNNITMSTLKEERDFNKDPRYKKLESIFKSDAITVYFASETVEAKALHYIAKKQYQDCTVVIVAGDQHIRKLEKHLLKLGSIKEECKGDVSMRKRNDHILSWGHAVFSTLDSTRSSGSLTFKDFFEGELFWDVLEWRKQSLKNVYKTTLVKLLDKISYLQLSTLALWIAKITLSSKEYSLYEACLKTEAEFAFFENNFQEALLDALPTSEWINPHGITFYEAMPHEGFHEENALISPEYRRVKLQKDDQVAFNKSMPSKLFKSFINFVGFFDCVAFILIIYAVCTEG